jgi:hypothetical protein
MEESLRGRVVVEGAAQGEALVTSQVFGFWGGVDPSTGVIVDRRHELYGQSIAGKVFVFPSGRGSTVGAAVILELARCGKAPAAILNNETEPILAAGGYLSGRFYQAGFPMLDGFDRDVTKAILSGDMVEVDGLNGTVRVLRK